MHPNPTPNVICQNCGESFAPKWKANPNRYCSATCRLDALHAGNRGELNSNWKPKVRCLCEWCGETFDVPPWHAELRRWCSRKCTDEAHRNIRGANHPLYKPKTPMACETCGTIRLVRPSLVSRFRFCSTRCCAIFVASTYPRASSIEIAVQAVLDDLCETYEAQRVFHWYIVDFYLPKRNLVIECDGTYWHASAKQQRLDRSKDGYMRTHGIGIVRLTEEEIRADAAAAVNRALHG